MHLSPRTVGLYVTGIGVAIMSAIVLSAMRRDQRDHGPALRRLTRGLGLGRADRALVRRLAQRSGSPVTASLLLSHGAFEAAVSRSDPEPNERDRLERLATMVFGAIGESMGDDGEMEVTIVPPSSP